MKYILTALLLFITSCNVRPFSSVRADGTTIYSLGGSVLTKSKISYASITLPDGSKMEYNETGKDEVAGPAMLAKTWAGVKVAEFIKDTTVSKDVTEASVAKAQIKSTTDSQAISAGVKKAKIAAEVSKAELLVPQ